MVLYLRVHRVRSQVKFPGPGNRSVLDEDLCEKTGISEWRKDAGAGRMH